MHNSPSSGFERIVGLEGYSIFSSRRIINKDKMADKQDKQGQQAAELPKDFRHLVRIQNTDLIGEKPLVHALLKIKGVGVMYANAVCTLAQVDFNKQVGLLNDKEIEKIQDVISNPDKYSIPVWLYNRRKDYEDGKDRHILTADIDYTRDNDIKRLKKIRAFRGVRHMLGQPVRGQRTKSNFRRNKGKVMGVKRSRVAPGAAESKSDKGKR